MLCCTVYVVHERSSQRCSCLSSSCCIAASGTDGVGLSVVMSVFALSAKGGRVVLSSFCLSAP